MEAARLVQACSPRDADVEGDRKCFAEIPGRRVYRQRPTLSVNKLVKVVSRLQLTIRRYHPNIKRISIEVTPTKE